jgi:putative integral membrane protein (TIGR02587 family)
MATSSAQTRKDRPEGGQKETDSALRGKILGMGRAFGGALIFSLPMLMTMELWWFGFIMDRYRMALLIVLALPVLVGLAHRVGFEPTFDWREDTRDAFIALAVGLVSSAVILFAFNVINPSMPADEIIGKIAIQSVPASIGALLGRSQFGGSEEDDEQEGEDESEAAAFAGYGGALFMMGIGALFLSLNVAPTEEMVLISYMMTPWHAVALVAVSLLIMHAFVYAVAFEGGLPGSDEPWWADFIRFTVVGYLICLLISLYTLWTLGRTEGLALMPILMAAVVLAFPAAIGAAAARLIL